MRLRKILVPVDFSSASNRALDVAWTIARESNADLVLAHVIPVSTPLMYPYPALSRETEMECIDDAIKKLDRLVSYRRGEAPCGCVARFGQVADEILSVADGQKPDLVVMGTHGRRAFRRWFLGSVTEHILRKLPAPILTVTDTANESHDTTSRRFRKILYATDLVEEDRQGFNAAMAWASQFGADLTLLHVIESMDWAAIWYLPPDFLKDRAAMVRLAEARLSEMVAGMPTGAAEFSQTVLEGAPYRVIVSYAEENGFDLVVLNLHGKSRLERGLLGSTAERVVRGSRVPVLSIPAHGGKENGGPDQNSRKSADRLEHPVTGSQR